MSVLQNEMASQKPWITFFLDHAQLHNSRQLLACYFNYSWAKGFQNAQPVSYCCSHNPSKIIPVPHNVCFDQTHPGIWYAQQFCLVATIDWCHEHYYNGTTKLSNITINKLVLLLCPQANDQHLHRCHNSSPSFWMHFRSQPSEPDRGVFDNLPYPCAKAIKHSTNHQKSPNKKRLSFIQRTFNFIQYSTAQWTFMITFYQSPLAYKYIKILMNYIINLVSGLIDALLHVTQFYAMTQMLNGLLIMVIRMQKEFDIFI